MWWSAKIGLIFVHCCKHINVHCLFYSSTHITIRFNGNSDRINEFWFLL